MKTNFEVSHVYLYFIYQIIQKNKDKTKLVYIADECLKLLDTIPDDVPISVIAVSGRSRIGKSFLLNCFIDALSYLEEHKSIGIFINRS